METEVTGATAPGVATGNGQETGRGVAKENAPSAQDGEIDAETAGVYEFPDIKTAGTVTVVKKWDDQSTNTERPAVDMVNINLSTQKPSKNPLGYTVTFHADAEKGLTFADGSTENEVVYNGNGQAVRGVYKGLVGGNGVVRWYADRTYKEQIALDENGMLNTPLTDDMDVWPKEVTFAIKGFSYVNEFNRAIPDSTTTVVFTDELMPADTALIDVDADGDGGVVAWTEADGTVMKVSTQIKGVKIQAAQNSKNMFNMFNKKSKIQTIEFTNLDTVNVTNMSGMFDGCSELASLDVSSFDTANVTRMDYMFRECKRLTSLDVTTFDTVNVTDMSYMFYYCFSLTSLDLAVFDTANVTDMSEMFTQCWVLDNLDISSFDTSNVTNMSSMFSSCHGLTSLDLSSFDTSNVTSMIYMFQFCNKLISLDVSSFDTANITDMRVMFYGCSKLTNLDLSSFDTSKVTGMGNMFKGCDALTTLTTGVSFKFIGTNYALSGTWQNASGETFTSGNLPSNVADTYTRIRLT